ncbi:MAG: MAE_28990/MAE_18760 family HEPN-like nuclease [Cytophagales bacterium]|nr:MAE_28990/MAE_18760 family HEPN-like nuclease [Cytophagales bacterium]
MIPSRASFTERSTEVELYFDFLKNIIDDKAQLIFPSRGQASNASAATKAIPIKLSHTLKANGYLLLYNLVEATIVNAIEDIHAQIKADALIDADKLVHSLTRQTLDRFKGKGSATIDQPVNKLLLSHWLDDHQKSVENNQHPVLLGNVDAKRIREAADLYGFQVATKTTNTSVATAGERLVEVKDKRNELAHGRVPFAECGRDTILPNLITIKEAVLIYLNDVLLSIESYLSEKKYQRSA